MFTDHAFGCIQKSSSAELSEAINSMFRLVVSLDSPKYGTTSYHRFCRWYKKSAMCYTYLSDVSLPINAPHDDSYDTHDKDWEDKFSASRWFTRGWTLQELITPRRLSIFSRNWKEIGSKRDLAPILLKITEIPEDTLIYGDAFGESVSRRRSWAAKRETTRIEDMAYYLLGIFDINMTLLYDEGKKHSKYYKKRS